MNGPAQASRNFYVLFTVMLVVAALRLAQDVFVPLALAVLLTFLLAPVVERLTRWGINRYVAVAVTVVVAGAILVGLLYVVFEQVRDVASELPLYRRQLLHNLTHLTGAWRGGFGRATHLLQELDSDLRRVAPPPHTAPVPKVEVVEPPLSGFQAMRQVFVPLLAPIATTIVVLVFVVFMLLRFSDVRDRIIRLLGARNLRLATEAIQDAANRVSRYLLMQTLINSWEGLCVAVGLTLIGVPNAILWGALTTVLRFIPYLGIWIAFSMPLIVSFAVFDHWQPLLLVVLLFGSVELLSYAVLEPWLYSRRTGVSPVALLASAVFWAWLWGAAGLFLAIPLTVCLVVLGKYIPQLAFLNVLLGDQPVLEPHEQLYQRLLANSPEEADELLEAQLAKHSLAVICDRVVLPTLMLLERDHQRGTLTEDKRQYVLDHIERWSEEMADAAAARAAAARAGQTPDRKTEAPRSSAGPIGTADTSIGTVPPVPQPSSAGAPVLCLPAADRTDEITAKLFAVALQESGFAARALPRERLRSLDAEEAPAVVVISLLPRDGVTHARALCRRVRVLFPGSAVLVGFWHAAAEPERYWARVSSAGASRMSVTFEGGLSDVQALTGPLAESSRSTVREVEARAPQSAAHA